MGNQQRAYVLLFIYLFLVEYSHQYVIILTLFLCLSRFLKLTFDYVDKPYQCSLIDLGLGNQFKMHFGSVYPVSKRFDSQQSVTDRLTTKWKTDELGLECEWSAGLGKWGWGSRAGTGLIRLMPLLVLGLEVRLGREAGVVEFGFNACQSRFHPKTEVVSKH